MHLYSVNLENTYQTGSANLSAVEQFELLGALIEVVAQGDAVAPALDFSALRPELDANRVSSLEHPAKGAFVAGSQKDTTNHNLRLFFTEKYTTFAKSTTKFILL